MPKTILFADDDALFRTVIEDGLRAAGYEVAVAGDGLEVLRRVREAPPDFILLDLIMPKLDGIRTCRLLKRHPQYRRIPVILLTGLAPEGLKAVEDLGAAAAVAKRQAGPTLDELLSALRSLEIIGPQRRLPVEPAQGLPERRIVSELLAERQHVQTLLATLGEGVIELDEEGQVAYVNPAGLELLGRSEDDILGTPGRDVLGPANAPAVQRWLQEVQEGAGDSRVRLELPLGSKTIGFTLTTIPRPDTPPGVLLVLRDLTDLTRRAQSLQRSLQALVAVGQHIVGKLDLPAVLREIVTHTADLVGAEGCALFRIDPSGDRLRLRCMQAVGLGDRLARDLHIAPGEGAVGKALATGRAAYSVDLLQDPSVRLPATPPPGGLAEGLGAVLAAPILLPDEAFGALTVYRPAGHRFTTEEVELVTSLAGAAAIAIENARLFRQEQERRRQLEAVRAVSEEIARELDLSALLGLIHQRAADLVGAASGAVWLWDEAGQVLVAAAWRDRREWMGTLRLKLGEGLAGLVAQRREGLIVNDYQTWPHAVPIIRERTGITAALAEPLVYRDRLLGVILIDNGAMEQRFTEEDRQTLALFAKQAAVAIENARLYAETRRAYEDLQAAQDRLVQGEKLRALGVMAAGLAHDFNNLLAVILGKAQLLAMRSADPNLRSGLEVIEQAALDGGAGVRRLLDFARVRPGTYYAPVDLAALIPQVLEVTRPRWKDEAQGQGAAIEAVLAVEPVPPVRGDAAELREALVNLVFNAVDAMTRGGRLTLGVRPVSRPDLAGAAPTLPGRGPGEPAHETQSLVEVFVRDTGEGMSEEVRRRAFDPFFTTKGVRGTGLGLSVVYGIVARHGGEVFLESREGSGTTVAIRLPATTEPAPAGTVAAPPSAARLGRIVVVDDEARLGEVLAELLRLQGHQVHTFTDPRRALDHLARHRSDLLFTDLGMPKMSGWDLARQARELYPDLPVILITGWGHDVDPQQVREHRVNGVVAKPYRAQDLLHLVAQHLPPIPEA